MSLFLPFEGYGGMTIKFKHEPVRPRVHIMFKSTRALILRETKYKEADKMLTVLTEGEGKQTVSAKGVLGKSGKISAACQLLCFSDMTLYESRGMLYVREAQTIEQFLGLREDISSLALGVYFAELLEAVSDEDSPNGQVLSLGLNSLFALSRNLYSQEHIKAVFELRLMCLSGFEPSLDYCPVCGMREPGAPVFSTLGGTVLCKDCGGPEYGEVFPANAAVLAAMRHISGSEPKKIFSFALGEEDEKRLHAICEAYVVVQLERCFSSLNYWKSVR